MDVKSQFPYSTLLFPLKRLVVLLTIRISQLRTAAIILFVLEAEDNPPHGECDVITRISEYSVFQDCSACESRILEII